VVCSVVRWNSLPPVFKTATPVQVFKTLIKIYLFKQAFFFTYEDTLNFLSVDFVLVVFIFRLVILFKLMYSKVFLKNFCSYVLVTVF